MRRCLIVSLFMVCLLALPFLNPIDASAGHGWHSRSAGWFIGGLALGTVIGSAATPYYYSPAYRYAAPVYVYPAPAYTYRPPTVYVPAEPANSAYAYPDPAYVEAHRSGGSGEWITVPGQWVDGKWVPEHKAWSTAAP